MRRMLSLVALALLLVVATVDPGQSKSRPYNVADITNGTGGTTDDHPWGGDNNGGGLNGGSTDSRPSLTISTGYTVIDYLTNRLLQLRIFGTWKQQPITSGETTTSTIGTTVPSNTQAN